jgi:hypothetical protein
MSAIPQNPLASAIQSTHAQREQSKHLDSAANEEADRARILAGGPDAILEIESTDADTRVHTDSGGLGSQGRHDAKPEEEETPPKDDVPAITVDDKGRPHIDFSA